MEHRQLDIILSNPDFFTIPKHVPGRLSTEDFVFFYWPSGLKAQRYCIVLESSDISGESYRKLCPLRKEVELPFVKFGPYNRIGVIPDDINLPSFEAILVRGSTYIIPDTRGKKGKYQMERHGKM